MFDKFKAVLQALIDDLYNKINDNNRRILALEQQIKDMGNNKWLYER